MIDVRPSSEEQLVFLTKLQRLFSEGDFTATYKFALMIALADLAVEGGSDPSPRITTRQIAVRFIALYWNHAREYGTGLPGAQPGVLLQNQGAQAAVITALRRFQQAHAGVTLARVLLGEPIPALRSLVSEVAATVADQPLKYLQNFGASTDCFLYDRIPGGILLKPGVAFCLRRFYLLVQQLARNGWLSHVKANRRNTPILGTSDDLESFLFRATRGCLLALGQRLRLVDGARCFYCGGVLTDTDVDHYVPFSTYPRDLAHNFVLAHARCNRSKSSALAARSHLERWLERLNERGEVLTEIGREVGMPADLTTTTKTAHWAYEFAAACGGHAWQAPSRFELIDDSYLTLAWQV